MILTIETLILLLFMTRLSAGNLTDESIDLCSSDEVNYNSYVPLKPDNCGSERTLIRKCCRSYFYYHHENTIDGQLIGRCEKDVSINFSVPIYDVDKKIKDLDFGFSVGLINCSNQEIVEVNLENKDSIHYFKIQQDGSWYYPHLKTSKNNTDYCVNARNGKTTYYYCKDPVGGNAPFRRAAAIIPIPFLLGTALVYAILPKKNIFTKSLIFHTLCLGLCYILVAVDQYDAMENVVICKEVGGVMMYLWYVSIFWMNVMCIDIWLTFSDQQGLRRRLGKENVLFIIFSIYAWGFGGLYMLLILFFDDYRVSPGIYNLGCFRLVLPSYWFYIANIIIFTVFNTLLYISTTINILRAKRRTAVLESSENGRHTKENNEKFTLYWNLFCVMSTRSMLYYLRLIHTTLRRYGWYQSATFDISVHVAYTLYTILIFVIFVCKKQVWRDLRKRYRHFTGKAKKSSTSTTISSQSTSQGAVYDVQLTSFNNTSKELICPEILHI